MDTRHFHYCLQRDWPSVKMDVLILRSTNSKHESANWLMRKLSSEYPRNFQSIREK